MAEAIRTIGEGFEVYVTGNSPIFEDQFTGSEVQDSNNCDPCLFDNTKTEDLGFCHECNEFLCDDCLQSHRKFRSFRDHNILTGSSMPRNKHTDKEKSVFKVCDDHRMNEVQFFCFDHKSVFCGLCKRGKHSSCETKTITETINDQDKASLLEAISNIDSIKVEFEKLKQKDCDKIDEVKQMRQNCKSRLKVIKKQMEEMFEELENEADVENTEESVVELKENIVIYEDAIKHITALDDHVKHITTSKDAVAIFAAQAKLRKLHAEYMIVKETFHFKAEKKVSQKFFHKITEIQKLFEDIQKRVVPEKAKDLGTKANLAESAKDDERKYNSEHKENSDKSEDVRNLNSATPHVIDSIKFNVQTSHGKPVEVDKGHVCGIEELEGQSLSKRETVCIQENSGTCTKKHKFEKLHILSKFLITPNQDETVPCNITGLTFLPNHFLVLCNNANSELILLDKSFEVCHKLALSAAPWDIALVKENKMAVTFPAVKQYMNVTVESKNLKLGSSNRTKRKCWGIAAHKDTLVLSCHDNPGNSTIEVRTSGQKLLEISIKELGEDALLAPYYIDINKSNGNIFVTDSARERLYCFSMEGQQLRKYNIKGIQHPHGVIVDDVGNCTVCVDNIMKLMLVKERTKSLEELWRESDIFTIWQSQKRIPQSIAINWENETIVVGHKSKNQIQVIRWFTKKSRGQSTAGKK